jgi:hypothetical protein
MDTIRRRDVTDACQCGNRLVDSSDRRPQRALPHARCTGGGPMYLHDPRTVGWGDVMAERETSPQRTPQGPAFRLECAAGCPPPPGQPLQGGRAPSER